MLSPLRKGKAVRETSYKSALLWGTRFLAERGVPSPQTSALALLRVALQKKEKRPSNQQDSQPLAPSLEELILICQRQREEATGLSPSVLSIYRRLVKKRGEHYPLPYLTGVYPFMDFYLRIKPGVFIPRPETEILVEKAIELLRDKEGIVIDVGVGSGAIAIALARFCPGITLIGIDIDTKALDLSRENAKLNKVDDRVTLVKGDLLNLPLPQPIAIVSNPPYIPTSQIPSLPKEVRQYEPLIALDGGEDGLEVIRKIVCQSATLLPPGGLLLLEVGKGQGHKVKRLMERHGFEEVTEVYDYSKIKRVVMGRKA